MRRAAVSIVLNIAEGKGRDSRQEYLHFLAIAQGSVAELETQIMLSVRLHYLSEGETDEVLPLCDQIGKMLQKLRTNLKKLPKK